MSNNLEETVRGAKSTLDTKGKERLQGTAGGRNSAPGLANSSATCFTKRNECPGITVA